MSAELTMPAEDLTEPVEELTMAAANDVGTGAGNQELINLAKLVIDAEKVKMGVTHDLIESRLKKSSKLFKEVQTKLTELNSLNGEMICGMAKIENAFTTLGLKINVLCSGDECQEALEKLRKKVCVLSGFPEIYELKRFRKNFQKMTTLSEKKFVSDQDHQDVLSPLKALGITPSMLSPVKKIRHGHDVLPLENKRHRSSMKSVQENTPVLSSHPQDAPKKKRRRTKPKSKLPMLNDDLCDRSTKNGTGFGVVCQTGPLEVLSVEDRGQFGGIPNTFRYVVFKCPSLNRVVRMRFKTAIDPESEANRLLIVGTKFSATGVKLYNATNNRRLGPVCLNFDQAVFIFDETARSFTMDILDPYWDLPQSNDAPETSSSEEN